MTLAQFPGRLSGWFPVLWALVGLLLGSFLNVVVYRVPLGMSLSQPPSHCPRCGHRLSPFENIPVLSWIVLRARCRSCGAAISARYPVTELANAIGYAGLAWATGATVAILPLSLIWSMTLVGTGVDHDGEQLTPGLIAAAVLGPLGLLAEAASDAAPTKIGWAIAGFVAAGGAEYLLEERVDRHDETGPRLRAARRLDRSLTLALGGAAAGFLWPPALPAILAYLVGAHIFARSVVPGRQRAPDVISLVILATGTLSVVLVAALVSRL